VGDHGGDGGVTRSGLKYRLFSPPSLVVEEDEVIMNNKSSILPSNIAAPLIWDMDGGSRAMKGPCITWVQWAPSSWRTSFKSLIFGAICKCCVMPYCFHHSYDILGAGMLWKPEEARILKNFINQRVNIR